MASVSDLIEELGGQTSLAAKLCLPPTTVASWKSRGSIPAERVIEIERATGMPRSKLRPDLYPNETAVAP